jgi:hypothetical protein
MNEAIFLQAGTGRVPAGSGCMSARLPAAPAEGPPRTEVGGDFSHFEATDGDAFLVQVFSDAELLLSRRYDEGMLRSRRVDEFSVVTHSGATYTLRYWGGPCALGVDASSSD